MAKIAFLKHFTSHIPDVCCPKIDSLGASEHVETAHTLPDIAHAMYATTMVGIMSYVGSECIISSF